MIDTYRLYLPHSKREVDLEVSGPRYKAGITFDTLYFLDGQNAFKDSHAAFGRSIRATKSLGFAASQMNRRIIGVAIYNSGSDMGRINEYTPFNIETPAQDNWKYHDTKICQAYCKDFVETIIPFIESKYNCYKSPDHRFIYGSSLAAVTAIYLGFKYPETFNKIAAFSCASFLFEKAFYNFLDEYKNTNKSVFLYVGANESSDDMYDSKLYLNSNVKTYEYFKKNDIRTRLVISATGIHNEETWEHQLLDFISFVYSDDIIYKL